LSELSASTASSAGSRPGSRLCARDYLAALGAALAVALLYALTQQTRYFGDGPGLVSLHVLGGGERYYNVLYLPACDLLQALFPFLDPLDTPRVLGVLAAALAAGLGLLDLRLLGAPLFGALSASALLFLAPSTWFFGTTPEVHVLHLAMVELAALAVLAGPWSRPAPALALAALAFPLTYLSHVAAISLGPGWVLLVQLARRRSGGRFSWPLLLGVVGPVLLAALIAAMLLACLWRYGTLAEFLPSQLRQVELHEVLESVGATGVTWRDEWLLPLGLLVPLAAVGLWRLRRDHLLLGTLGLLLGVPLGLFLWWSVTERGGYLMGSNPFLVVPVGHLFGRWTPRKGLLLLLLLVLQGGLGLQGLRHWDQGWDAEQRVAQVRRAIGESGVLLSSVTKAPDIRCSLPGVEEIPIKSFLRGVSSQRKEVISPAEAAELVLRPIERLVAGPRPVVVEIGYLRAAQEPNSGVGSIVEHLGAIERTLREHFLVRDLPDPYWPMMVLRPRP